MPIMNHKTMRVVDHFTSRFNIVVRKQPGTLSRSSARVKFIQKQGAYHLGEMKHRFDAGMDQSMVQIMDETHFSFNFQSGKTFEFRGYAKVNLSGASSGGEEMTEKAKVETTSMILKNRNCAYPINGVTDNLEYAL